MPHDKIIPDIHTVKNKPLGIVSLSFNIISSTLIMPASDEAMIIKITNGLLPSSLEALRLMVEIGIESSTAQPRNKYTAAKTSMISRTVKYMLCL